MSAPSCLGLLGWIFGHKFVKSCWSNPTGECFRCGYKPGRSA